MANNQYVNKVIYGGQTLIDLTPDTVTAADVLKNVTFHLPSGASGVGSCEYDVDSSDCTAVVAEVLYGETFAKGGTVLTGTMPNRGAISASISSLSPYTVPNGYHDGSGTVSVDSTNISSGNIKSGVTILGVEGTYTGESITTQTKTVTPTSSQQVITADQGYDYLAQVTVNAIPYTETDNAAGGKTVTIGAA